MFLFLNTMWMSVFIDFVLYFYSKWDSFLRFENIHAVVLSEPFTFSDVDTKYFYKCFLYYAISACVRISFLVSCVYFHGLQNSELT